MTTKETLAQLQAIRGGLENLIDITNDATMAVTEEGRTKDVVGIVHRRALESHGNVINEIRVLSRVQYED